jgi:RNA polymerase sigma-70 factor, ECF subfamily
VAPAQLSAPLPRERSSGWDVAHDAFIEIWQHPNGFNPARATLKSYVFGIARKRAADWWRSRRSSEVQAPRAEASLPGEPRALIEDALAQLEPDVRSLLWLREVEGYSYAELAEILGAPLGTIKSRLFTAREQLRKVWKGDAIP